MRPTSVLYLLLAIVAYAIVAERRPEIARFVPYTLTALLPLLIHVHGRIRERAGPPAAPQRRAREAETR
jgi:hypothetical protein